MFGLGTQELVIILILVMIVFGAGKLPNVGGALGKGIRNFKKGMQESGDETTPPIQDQKEKFGKQGSNGG